MKTAKRKRLERAGWRVSPSEEFLGLSDEERALVDIRLSRPPCGDGAPAISGENEAQKVVHQPCTKAETRNETQWNSGEEEG
jgi:hypothetical protein